MCAMRFFKLIKYDLKNGFSGVPVKLMLLCLIVVASCVELTVRKSIRYMGQTIPESTLLDYACYLLGGIKIYIPSVVEGFQFPVKWFFLHMLVLYGTLNYPYRDLESLGSTILPKSGNRLSWWLSKCVWNMLHILLMYGVIFGVMLFYCLISKERCSLTAAPELVNDIMASGGYYESFPPEFALTVLLLPVLVSLSGSVLQMTLGLYLKPMFSFGVLAVLMLAASYLRLPVLPGSYGMAIRSKYVVEGGFEPMIGSLLMVGILSGAVLLGGIRFRKYDILSKE